MMQKNMEVERKIKLKLLSEEKTKKENLFEKERNSTKIEVE